MPQARPPVRRSIRVSGANRAERVESVLRQADATLEDWFRRAKKRSAGVLRRQVDSLQVGLKKLSAGLGQMEHGPTISAAPTAAPAKTTPGKRRPRLTIARKPSAARKRKKTA
jgi:hypothetical protein